MALLGNLKVYLWDSQWAEMLDSMKDGCLVGKRGTTTVAMKGELLAVTLVDV